jgi:hypothetical protein
MEFVNQNNRPANAKPVSGPRRGLPMWLAIVFVVLVLMLLGAALFKDKLMTSTSVTSDYQAVFLTNGQVYFGKLDFQRGWAVMNDIYYLQLAQDLQPASSADPNQSPQVTQQNSNQQQIQLVKLGSELHGPEDEMFIAKDKILFWENMKDDSRVLQSIREYQNRN